MRAADVMSKSPSPEELEALSKGLVEGRARDIDELRALFDGAADTSAREEWPPFLQRPREYTDTRAGGPPTSHRPVLGPVLVATKTLFRAAAQPFINEIMRTQVRFNEAILDAVAQVHDQLQQNAENQALFRKQLDARLKTIEDRLAKSHGEGG